MIDVLENTRPGADTVLLSAGLGGTAGYWAPQLAALRERYRVVTYDQAGTGRNRRKLPADHSITAMADEVLAVLDATETKACHFVGHALGGLAGLRGSVKGSRRSAAGTRLNATSLSCGSGGGGDLWVSECVITYDGVPTYSVSVMEFTGDLVTHETQYFADPFPAPAYAGGASRADPWPRPMNPCADHDQPM